MSALSLILLALALLGPPGCSPSSGSPIEVLGAPDTPRMQQVVAGLRAGLDSRPLRVTLFSQAEADGADKLRQVRGRRPPLLIVLGTPALMLTAPAEKKIPVVFAMVANPYFTGAAYDPQRPEVHQRNVTGIASPPPVAAALEQGARLLGRRPWGLIYAPLDGASLEIKEQFESLAPKFGLMPLTEASAEAATDQRALDNLLARGAKALYLPPTASAGRYGPVLLEMGRRRQIMVVSSHPELSGNGAILRVVIDYQRLGGEAAALAKRILSGQEPGQIPIAEQTPLAISADEALLNFWSGYPPANR
jgi:ABC-type uncharacterized transport system substrate-binding protein